MPDIEMSLPATIDMPATIEIDKILKQALQDGAGIVVSAADVERLGTPTVQVLVAAAQSFGNAGQRFRISLPSDAVRLAFRSLGLEKQLLTWSA